MLNSILYLTLLLIVASPLITINSFGQWTIPTLDSLTKDNTTKFSTYENKDATFKIDYPSNWTLSENTPNEIEFQPQAGKSGDLVQMRITPLSSPSITMQSIVGETLKNKSDTLNNFQLEDSNMVPNAQNIPMHKLVYSYTNSNNENIMQLDFGIINNNQLYLLSFISNLSEYYHYIPTVDKMIGSINKYFNEISLSKFSSDLAKPVTENVKPLGNEDANITLIEFADYRCPFCHKFEVETFDKILNNFINNGKIKYVFKDFVVNDRGEYKGSMQAAVASHCAAEQGKYWEYSREIYDNFKPEPQQWVTMDSLTNFANNVQIPDVEKFKSCVESNKYQNHIQESGLMAKKLSVTGTPTFVILKNDKIANILPGAIPYDGFAKALTAIETR